MTPIPDAMIASANIEEVWPKGDDLKRHGDVRTLVRRLLRKSPYEPDVVLLQEASRRSARFVAARLRARTGKRYSVAVRPARRPVVHTGPKDVTISETAIVINNTTMKTIRKGTVSTTHRRRHAESPDRRRATIVHSLALVKRRGTSRSYGVASLHFHGRTAIKNAVDDEYRRRWARAVARKLKALAPAHLSRRYAIGGDFNQVGQAKGSVFGTRYRPFWRYLTRRHSLDPAQNQGREMTHLFVSNFVLRGMDQDRGFPISYSDHPFRWAVLGDDTIPPTRPEAIQRFWSGTTAAPEIRWRPSFDYTWDEPFNGLWSDWTGRWPARSQLWRSGDGGPWELVARVPATAPRDGSWRIYVDESAVAGVTYRYRARSIDRVGLKSAWTKIRTAYRGEPPPD